jgi:DNA-binding IclR family transcriptional regulator
MNQQKFERLYAPRQNKILKLIPFLQEKPRPLQSIANHLEVHKDSVRVYIGTLRDLEVEVKQDGLKKYYIDAAL